MNTSRYSLLSIARSLLMTMLFLLSSPVVQAQGFVPLQDVAQVATRNNHTCALTTGGGVKCWGAEQRRSAR